MVSTHYTRPLFKTVVHCGKIQLRSIHRRTDIARIVAAAQQETLMDTEINPKSVAMAQPTGRSLKNMIDLCADQLSPAPTPHSEDTNRTTPQSATKSNKEWVMLHPTTSEIREIDRTINASKGQVPLEPKSSIELLQIQELDVYMEACKKYRQGVLDGKSEEELLEMVYSIVAEGSNDAC